jgi:multidrug efflux pump subunit AcrB
MDLAKLEAYGVGPQAIAAALERENLNAPAGPLKEGGLPSMCASPEVQGHIGYRGLVVGAWQAAVHLVCGSVEDTFKELEITMVNDNPPLS